MQKTVQSQSINSPVDQILFLQRTMGNQAVLRLIKSGALQTKVRIGQPGDLYEQEADRMAEQVMMMPELSSSSGNGINKLLAHEVIVMQQPGSSSNLQREVDQSELDQFIAELGGSTSYRDAGIATPEELEGYRQECLTRLQPQSSSRAIENLSRAWGYAREQIGEELAREIENLFSPTSLALMAIFAAAYIGSQFTPVGWIADALALIVLAGTAIFVGTLVISIARDLYTFFSAVNATTDEELRNAGQALARALVRGGIGILIALLSHGVRGRTRAPPSAAPAIEIVEVVEVGIRYPVLTANTAAEAVELSRLRQLASFAVMVPPPGGSDPSSPSTSSGGGRRRESVREGNLESSGRAEGSNVSPGSGIRFGNIAYGEGPLSQLAQRMRLMINLRRGGNVAVFEFDNIPANFRLLTERLGGRNVHIEGNRMAVQNVDGSAHSERLAHMLITEGRRAGIELNVNSIYSEYNPCTQMCLPLIRRYYPNANLTYSFIWERWGRQTPDRNAAVDAIFRQNTPEGGSNP